MGSFSTVTGLFRHEHTTDVAQGGSLTVNTVIDSTSLQAFIMLMSLFMG